MDLNVIINQLIILFVIMFIGFIVNKCGILNAESNRYVSKLLLTVGVPGLLINSVADGNPFENNYDIFGVLFVCILINVFIVFVAWVLDKIFHFKDKAGVYKFMTIFPNAGFIGFPVINAIFGPTALIYATAFQLPHNVLCYTYGMYLMSNGFDKKEALKSMINPCIVSAILACIICIFDIHLPSIVSDCCGYLGSITTPLGMVIIGSSLASSNVSFKQFDLKMTLFILLKMFIVPVACFFFLSLISDNQVLISVLTIIMGLPCATNTVVFATINNKNVDLASKSVFLTTMLCIISIPILCYIFVI